MGRFSEEDRLVSLVSVIDDLDLDIWNSCFPSHLPSIPEKSPLSLPLCVVKLQNKHLKAFENLDFENRFSITKINNPVFAAFLNDIKNSTCLITQQPRRFGLHLSDEAWKLNMRLRLGLFPAELLDSSECICSHRRIATFRHVINCPKFIQFRSVLHNAVRDVTFEMFKAHRFHAKVEPLCSKLGLDLINNSRRGDLHGPFVDSSQIILDVTTVDPCAQTYVNGLNSKGFNHLETDEKRKIDLDSKDVAKLNQNLYSKFVFVPFAISIFSSIGEMASKFLTEFGSMCKSQNKRFNLSIWHNRLIFSVFRSVPKFFKSIFTKLYKNCGTIDQELSVSSVS
ncbi:hypothetical protein GEMRC1_011933 [Eukaryota sp. GEM-RC1]